MPELTTSRTAANAPVRSGRKRLGYAIVQGVKTVAVSVVRTVYVLWLEVTGLAFAMFTVVGASSFYRLYRNHAWTADPQRFWVTAGFTIFCGWLTLVSFLRARRTRRPSK